MDILATVTIPSVTNIPRDSSVSGFAIHVEAPGFDPVANVGEISMPLAAFYNGVQANGGRVAQWLSGSASRTAQACDIKLYDITGKLGGQAHGSPVSEDSFTLGASAQLDPLPDEVSFVTTLHAFGAGAQPVEAADGSDAGSLVDRPRQRYTGRMYLPFLSRSCIAANVAPARPTPDLGGTLRQAYQKLSDDLNNGGILATLCVWSRKDSVMRGVEFVSTDDAFDTQRRRGVRPTARIIAPLAV